MDTIDYYRILQRMDGCDTKREGDIRAIKEELSLFFKNSIDTEEVNVNGYATNVLITKTENVNIKRIKSHPDESIQLGDVVEWLDSYWLIYEIDGDNRIQSKGRMKRCNTQLKWKNASGNIVSAYGVFEDSTKYSSGVQGGTMLEIGDFQIKVLLHMDDDTKVIVRDQRFIIDLDDFPGNPSVYRVTRRNVITGIYGGAGYVELSLCEDQFIAGVDDAVNGIANANEAIGGSIGLPGEDDWL